MPEKTRLLKKLFAEYLQTQGKANNLIQTKQANKLEAEAIHQSEVYDSDLILNTGLLITGLTCIALIIKLIIQ